MTDILTSPTSITGDSTVTFHPAEGESFTLSLTEVGDLAATTADRLRDRGVRAGDVVAAVTWTSVEAFTTYYAASLLDGVFAAVIPIFSARDAAIILEPLQPSALLAPAAVRSALGFDTGVWRAPHSESGWEGRAVARTGRLPSDAHVVIHTSGTSASPKRVVHSEASLSTNCRSILHAAGVSSTDRFLHYVPPGHALGTGLLRVPLEIGCHVSVLEIWNASRALDIIRSDGVTFMAATPFFLSDLLRTASPGDLASLGRVLVGGDALSEELIAAAERHEIEVLNFYALSEMAVAVASGANRLTPLDETAVEINVDGAPVAFGDVGDVVVSSRGSALAFVDDDGSCRPLQEPYRTADRGSPSADGSFVLTGRAGDFIIRGGENISLLEVDRMLMSIPGILEAASAGRPSGGGQQLVAAIVTDGRDIGYAEVVRAARLMDVSGFKVPRRIRRVDRLPRTALGKLSRPDVSRLWTDGDRR